MSNFDPPQKTPPELDPFLSTQDNESFAGRWLGRRRRNSENRSRIIGSVALFLGIAGFAWWWFGMRTPGEAPFQLQTAVASPPTSSSEVESIDLPPLTESDSFVREVVSFISSHPEWTRWIVTDRIIERFVVSVVNVANGDSPAEHLAFLAPSGDFTVQEGTDTSVAADNLSGTTATAALPDRTLVDPTSYERYDLFTTTLISVDVPGAAELYHQLKPLLDEAYRELGFPESDFDEPMTRAIQLIVSVQLPAGPIEVVREVESYEFVDPALESLTPAEKQVLRMGPKNAAQLQAKLRQLATAIGLQLTGANGP